MAKKRGPGRPPLAKKKVRSARFEIRLTGDTFERWQVFADKQGLTMSKMVEESVETAIGRGSTR
jgi:hypothetical protein